MPSARRHWRAILLLLVLVPSISFVSWYAVGLASAARTDRYAQEPGDWSVNMTITHPAYLVSGEQVPVTLSIGIKVPNSNFTVGVSDVGVETRQPTTINGTSGVVTSWNNLGSVRVPVNQNFSRPGYVTKVLTVMAVSPPTGGASDLLVPTSAVAFNGFVDLLVYQTSGNVTLVYPQSISLLESVTFYQTELSTIASTSSWLTYQLLASVVGLAVLVRYRPTGFGAPTDSYSTGLKSYRAERALARLEEMLKSGMIGQRRYEELKQGFMKELEKLKGG